MKYILFAMMALVFSSCGSDQVEQPSAKCTDQELYDQLKDQCVPRIRDQTNPDMGNNDTGHVSKTDVATDLTSDVVEDTKADTGIPPGCDKDGDFALAEECGGNDCNDNSRQIAPGYPDLCDGLDNDCDGIVDNGPVVCTFYAHTGETDTQLAALYEVSPFQNRVKKVGDIELPGNNTRDSLKDIDTHRITSLLYGVNSKNLFVYDSAKNSWKLVGAFGRKIDGATGMAIDNEGTMFVTARENVYTIDLNNGHATLLGQMGGTTYSSGDCVVNKHDTLFMTSKGADHSQWNEPNHFDELISIERATGIGTKIGTEDIGFKRVYGLVSGWGELWGVTAGGTKDKPVGEIIRIDQTTGKGELVHSFPGIRFYGSASSPNR